MIDLNNELNHDHSRIRTTGSFRNEQARDAMAFGIQNLLSSNVLKNFDNNTNIYPTKPSIIKQMKYELSHQLRLSTELCSDLNAAKILTDKNIFTQNPSIKSGVLGFVHHICLHPFGFILISDLQVRIWNNSAIVSFSIIFNF